MTDKAQWTVSMEGDLYLNILERLDKITKKIEEDGQKLNKIVEQLREQLENKNKDEGKW